MHFPPPPVPHSVNIRRDRLPNRRNKRRSRFDQIQVGSTVRLVFRKNHSKSLMFFVGREGDRRGESGEGEERGGGSISVFYLFFQKVNFFSTKIFTHCIKSCFYYGPPQARNFLLFLWFFVDFPLKNEAKLRKFRPRVQKVYLLASQKVNFLPF